MKGVLMPVLTGSIFLILAIIVLGIGFLKLYASKLMKDPKKTITGGLIALIVGVLTGPDVLCVIGGIFVIVDGEKKK